VNIDETRLQRLTALLEGAVAAQEAPGAVAVVARHDAVLFHQAFGYAQVVPQSDPMRPDTVFDLASLTKVVATAPCLLALVEDGVVALRDPAARYVTAFTGEGKEKVDLRHLLTHCSGLPAWKPFYKTDASPEALIASLCATPLEAAPGSRYLYSDLGFIVLGEVIRRASSVALDRFAQTRVFGPLGMRDTRFCPPPDWAARCAATEVRDGQALRGSVHDENAAALGGVAGHAGLFSTAADLARFCRMLLNGGTLDGTRILSPLGTRTLLAALSRQGSGVRGNLLPPGAAGQTGFTGTWLCIDADLDLAIILLTNAVHPTRNSRAMRPRAQVANVVAAALSAAPARAHEPARVLPGADVLRAEGCRRLHGQGVGLITNHTGRCVDGTSTLDMLLECGVAVKALFTPEHGIAGGLDAEVASSRDERTGLPIHSLYGQTRRPLPEWLAGLDTLVFDIQDIGARFYTYITTMGMCMEEAAKHGKRMIVLDRPNPITGTHIEGPLMEAVHRNFAGYYAIPVRHGLTVGELARLCNAECGWNCDLQAIPVQGWQRAMWWDETGLEWINPSPAMRTLTAATLYPGLCCLENTNLSMGRGTDSPFEIVGAPWLDGRRVAVDLNARALPGIGFVPISFTPAASVHAGRLCGGVRCIVRDREALRPVALAVHLADALHRIHTDEFTFDKMAALIGTDRVRDLLNRFAPPDAIVEEWAADEAHFAERRAPHLLYG
jgi:uncharacterized protein YbbC (DUF1343 family)/CubicO group peptidase (beta-lactamase class C family)